MQQHENVWSKVSCPERLSISGPQALQGQQNAYQDVVPFARHVVQTFPDRVLWGTDWPHPGAWPGVPRQREALEPFHPINNARALQRLSEWTTADQWARILVDNPARLYGF